jgi:hypothetical protein
MDFVIAGVIIVVLFPDGTRGHHPALKITR